MQLKILTLLLELKVIIATNHYGYDYLHREILVTGADSDWDWLWALRSWDLTQSRSRSRWSACHTNSSDIIDWSWGIY